MTLALFSRIKTQLEPLLGSVSFNKKIIEDSENWSDSDDFMSEFSSEDCTPVSNTNNGTNELRENIEVNGLHFKPEKS